MVRTRLVTLTVLACVLAAASWVAAQGTPPPKTPTPTPVPFSADPALRQLAAWQHQQARPLLEPVQASQGATAAFKTAWGLLRGEEGKLDEALTNLAAAASADARDPAPQYFQGEVLSWQRKTNDAKTAWQGAYDRAKAMVTANPNDARAQYYLGAALVRLQKYAEARAALDAALAIGFDVALVRYQKGLSFAFERNWQASKQELDAVITADSGFAHAYYYRGRVWKELKRTDEMLLDMGRFLKLAPDSPEAPIARSILGG